MANNNNFEEQYLDFANNTKSAVSNYIYYILAFAVVVVMVFLQLGGLEFNKDIQWYDIIVDAVPIFVATIILDKLFYECGADKGKKTKKYYGAVLEYSNQVNLGGDQFDKLPDFCREFNEKVKREKQRVLLASASVSLNVFEERLKVMTNKEIKNEFGKERAKWIIKAKKTKIKGISAVNLTSEQQSQDETDTGYNENTLAHIQSVKKILGYAVSLCVFSAISIKDVAQWGWAGIGLLLFKILFSVGCCILSQIRGFKDLTVTVVSHYNRKTDILKKFHSWYNTYTTKKNTVSEEEKTAVTQS